MKPTIENDHLKATFHLKGGELCSLISKKTGIEHIWQADPGIWGGHAPVLFPIVGRLKDDRYQYQGQTYSMPQHGFARKREFDIAEHTASAIWFVLESDKDTLAVYPFDFKLLIGFELEGNELTTTYKVINEEKGPLYFSIGAHPGFNCALHEGELRSDYRFEFEKAEKLERHLISGGLYTGETETVLDGSTTSLPITNDLFKKDALVFKGQQSDAVHLVNKAGKKEITLRFAGFPYLGLWSQAAVPNVVPPYVCIEPWYGLADSVKGQTDLSEKEGMIKLEKGAAFECSFQTKVHQA